MTAYVEAERVKADMTTQETKTLVYEAEQFRVPDLWHMASPPRQKVLTLREKVFGTGGRRLPTGVHGAHGRFNRLQWTLDGRERLVDQLGRTESEAEEDSKVDPNGEFTFTPGEDEEDVVEHPGIKPMWLLRFFTSWGASKKAEGSPPPAIDAETKSVTKDATTKIEDSPVEERITPLARSLTVPT